MNFAALDMGSNSFHVLVARAQGGGELVKLGSQKEVLRLGAVVREGGELPASVFASSLATVGRLVQRARALGAERVHAVATSAIRDARNGEQFCATCRDEFGIEVRLLSGEEEAHLAYIGARSALSLSGRVLVADIGAGSIELAEGVGSTCESARSLPLGFLRLERAFAHAGRDSARLVMRHVRFECEKARWQLGRVDTLVLSGGTARAIGKLLGGGIGARNSRDLAAACEELATLSEGALIERGVDPQRAQTLPTGACVVAGLVQGLGQIDVRISPRGLREGVLLSELSRSPTRAA